MQNDGTPRKRWRFGLKQLFFWPFFLSPLFLMPVTMRQSHGTGANPLMQLASQVIVPMIYVAVLVWMRYRDNQADIPAGKSVVFAAIRRGIGYSLLMAVMSWGWLLYRPVRRLTELAWEGLVLLAFRDLVLPALLAPAFIGLYYLVIGAATGGVVGLFIDRRKIARTRLPAENQNSA